MNTQTVKLDVTKRPAVMPVIYLGQGDKNGTTLIADIYDNGAALTLTGYTVKFVMKQPHDAGYYNVTGTVSGSTATFAIDENYAAAVAGVTECAYVEVLSGSTVICSTNRMRVVVLEGATEGVDPSTMYDNGLNDAISRAITAAEAAEGVVLQDVPTMTENVKGGAKLGSGLEVTSSVLSLDLVDSATGTSITADDASYLEGLTIEGKAVQNGTPTPSAPVEIDVVQDVNALPESSITTQTVKGITITQEEDGWLRVYGTSTNTSGVASAIVLFGGDDISLFNEGTFTVCIETEGAPFATGSLRPQIKGVSINSSSLSEYLSSAGFYTKTDYSVLNRIAFLIASNSSGASADGRFRIMVSAGENTYPYIPYGSLGINVNGTATPIDLQGNALASLPDGTKDELTVDSAGHVELVKRVSYTNQAVTDGVTGTVGTDVLSSTGAIADGADVYYKAASSTTTDLGYIDMPSIADGAAISITAQVTPTITASWWARGASAIATAIKALRDDLLARIEAIETAIADL